MQCVMPILTPIHVVGTVVDADAKDLLGQGRELKESKPRKEDIVTHD
jgi:LETM1 and EF-hand domain-containing protein 1